MNGPCQLCERETALTRHHLVPQCRHHNKWNKKNFDRRTIKTDLLLLCAGCHRHLHALFTEKELERRFHDLPSLRAHPEVEKFVVWLRTKPPGFKPPSSRVRKVQQGPDGSPSRSLIFLENGSLQSSLTKRK